MSLLKKLVRYSRFSTGDFEKIFQDFQIPPCPQVVLALMEKLKNPDIDIDQIVPVLESDASLAGHILRVVNSALYALPAQVTSVGKAVSILGLREIENIAIAYAMTKTVRDPQWEEFDAAGFWADSILRAVFARKTASHLDLEAEEAFSAGLLQDIAVPQLLSQWFDLYSKVYSRWKRQEGDLHQMEMDAFSWNHCQAGAWIAKKWELPDLFVCCIGLHGASQSEIAGLDLQKTAVAPVALSSRLSHVAFSESTAARLLEEAGEMGITPAQLVDLVEESETLVDELASVFGVKTSSRPSVSRYIASIQEA